MAKGRVTKDDWTMAALRALARGGLPAVAVDVLARELAVSRGSFYWHFENREALLVAALETWERHATAEVITAVRAEGDPRARARMLFAVALGTEEIAGLEPALVAHTAHPAVAEVVARVTRTRLDFLAEIFGGLGFGPQEARHRALAGYAAYLGWLELRRTAPDTAPEALSDGPGAEAALDHFITMILTPAQSPA
ncbi:MULTISPECIES: TetR/AcrR family transcriptional regulator [unclassified Streptomyces]|uniref:TetR/AcrR family transcriptional regulator n=1 Tax=unclassified Streptomyces TaxID=2593676 RepID=UPI002E0FD932|nr:MULTISPECIES: TetR/AcrR family transcriptional regulator [unclassified Streptomyces]WSR24371.1 TetR/AcrR family transcriptional regulator [Streptomyces sp. NBC_01205]